MRIEAMRSTATRVEATIVWEDCDRPAEIVFFETDDVFARDVAAHQDALLIGCAIPAMRYGERRIVLDGTVCPHLRQNLMMALSYLRAWFYDSSTQIVQIEVPLRKQLPDFSGTTRRTGLFFSGGIDSLATLRCNHLSYPAGHPYRTTDGILVCGFEILDHEVFVFVRRHLRLAAAAAGIRLVLVCTNLYSLFRPDDEHLVFLINQFEGAFFSAIAQLFQHCMHRVELATTLDIDHLTPNGSHPLLDYSSCALRMAVDGLTLSRFEKARLLAPWDVARRFLRVCNKTERYRPDRINCGACNKCVGTMLMFTAIGIREDMPAFRGLDLDANIVRSCLTPRAPYQQSLCRELIPALIERGRRDLAEATADRLAAFHVATTDQKAYTT